MIQMLLRRLVLQTYYELSSAYYLLHSLSSSQHHNSFSKNSSWQNIQFNLSKWSVGKVSSDSPSLSLECLFCMPFSELEILGRVGISISPLVRINYSLNQRFGAQQLQLCSQLDHSTFSD